MLCYVMLCYVREVYLQIFRKARPSFFRALYTPPPHVKKIFLGDTGLASAIRQLK